VERINKEDANANPIPSSLTTNLDINSSFLSTVDEEENNNNL